MDFGTKESKGREKGGASILVGSFPERGEGLTLSTGVRSQAGLESMREISPWGWVRLLVLQNFVRKLRRSRVASV